MSMYPRIPVGYTQQEVLDAGRRLPRPDRETYDTRRFYRVAVMETCERWYPGTSRPYQDSVRMRTLEFELECKLDYREDRVHYFWSLVGGP